MDNFHLQVTPVELTYQCKDPIALSCLIKKVMPSGGAPERYEVRPSGDLTSGKAIFDQGATFAMNKEMELRNTKISLNFFNRNDRNAFLIGSTDLDVSSLPAHPYALLELKLDNCNDPKARLKLQIQRKEMQAKNIKKENGKPYQMGILRTEGQLREEAALSRRANPNIPTAYQISRRNYKQAEVSCHEEKKSQGKKHSISGKKGSYLQQRVAMQGKSTKISQIKNEEKNSGESPMPRKQTPEPIRIGTKQDTSKPTQQAIKYAISKGSKANHSHTSSIHTQPNIPNEELGLEPQKLRVRPYKEDENMDKANRETILSLQEEKNQKYRNIVEKFQLIHDKIAQSRERGQEPSENSSECSHNHRSCFEEREGRLPPAVVNSFTHLSAATSNPMQTPKILDQSVDSSSQKEERTNQLPSNSNNFEKQFQNIKSVKTKSPDASPPSEKTVSFKSIPSNVIEPNPQSSKEEIINDRQIELAELQALKQQNKSLKNDLASAFRTVLQRDREINQLHEELNHFKSLLEEKQALLDKLNREYELRFEEIFTLKERVAVFEEERARQKEKEKSNGLSINALQAKPSEETKQLGEDLLKARKRIVEVESQLKFKENENRCLLLQLDNLKRQKGNLQQQVQVLVSRDKNQMTRKASLARIEQINNNSLANHAKRENEALRNEVKLLQQKLQSLNSLFQSLLSPNEKSRTSISNMQPIKQNGQLQRRTKILEQKCGLLQQQLKQKKNQLAQIINIIWKHEDGDIMNDVLTLIAAEKTAS